MDSGLRRLMRSAWTACLVVGVSPAFGQNGPPVGGFGGDLFGPATEESAVKVAAQLTVAKAGQPGRLFVTATIKDGWHIYSITQPPGGPQATKIELTASEGMRLPTPSQFRVTPAPDRKRDPVFDNMVVESHHGTVTWYAPVELPVGIDPKTLQLAGTVKLQACDANTCVPQKIAFVASLGPGVPVPEPPPPDPSAKPGTSEGDSPIFAARKSGQSPSHSSADPTQQYKLQWQPYRNLAQLQRLLGPSFDPEVLNGNLRRQIERSSLWREMLFGFIGGLILNVMPCVLPVIGLKVLSFVEQSGHDRRRALLLNVWYSAGLMSIFLLLATLAVFLNLGWGNLFKYAGFNIVLAAVVFAMGLSFLGVWEIPIPGFVGRGSAVNLAQKEGLSAAFAKGVITTILATPCTGPFMGTALAWAVNQPPAKTYLVFTSVGLGMASPYLLIGAFPALVRFLPKPGAWMETFKQLMGFVLMGTVVFIFTFLPWPFVVPTIALLFALWAACWWIGRTPLTAEFGAKARAWLEATAFVGLAWLLLFPGLSSVVPGRFAIGGLYEVMRDRFQEKIDREIAVRFDKLGLDSPEQAAAGRKQQRPTPPKTVIVDCTADWCGTCKTLERYVLHTPEVERVMEENRVVALKADWTDAAPDVTELLKLLVSNGVPVVAVFSANDPNNPTGVFRGAYTQEQLLDALRKAGPSAEAM